ncbi:MULTISPECIES: AraC family transcriptional regulator [unclassified Pseudodesulfovibrio]|uniref:helix-turn-helix domain-containing protein n=1 Tax=unclassified Pseudodesulfovibrio TaxID=2661612 RepID=UPI000FEB5F9D|nr:MULTISPECIES: AraC family transcriptional regulator [unclassified Pseudodesulfovibrio]MCJ2163397.1 AraC family transcriptional regulator [Pseudodesulfovibrio sp. S3-i]RWU06633.1 AraC family transcriptional regulator [Pseudodesulfovibrio sp. S3]
MYMESHCGVWTKGYSPIVEQYREYYGKQRSFVEIPALKDGADQSYRWEVAQGFGEGFTELQHLNSGPGVGLCGYRLGSSLDSLYRKFSTSFSFCLLLSGHFKIASPDGRHSETVQTGDIWFCNGEEGEVRCMQPAERFISGVSIVLSQGMLDAWLGGTSCELSRSLERHMKMRLHGNAPALCGAMPKARALPHNHPARLAANNLCMTRRDTVCGRLQFESLALDLLCQLLMLEESLKRHSSENLPQRQKAVEQARSILDEEWGAPPTISSLSRRVGVNECYLKTDFREQTGLSIGAYVRKLRMERALNLIKSGRCSVLQAATFVGYSNPSHFSKAFKRFHGRLPSSFLIR